MKIGGEQFDVGYKDVSGVQISELVLPTRERCTYFQPVVRREQTGCAGPFFAWAIITLFAFGTAAVADDTELFERQVRPVLVGTCLRCHGPEKQNGGLRVDSRDALLKGGDSGPATSFPKDAACIAAGDRYSLRTR